MSDLIIDIATIAIIILYGYVAAVDLIYFFKAKKDVFRFNKILYFLTGIYWLSMYLCFLLYPQVRTSPATRYWIMFGLLFTGISLSMGATARAYLAGIFGGKK